MIPPQERLQKFVGRFGLEDGGGGDPFRPPDEKSLGLAEIPVGLPGEFGDEGELLAADGLPELPLEKGKEGEGADEI